MTQFRAPEIATARGGLDDDAFVSGQPLSAHILREMIRQSNLQSRRSNPVFRWFGNGVGGGRTERAPAFWQVALPCGEVVIRKTPGVGKLRCRVRVLADSGRRLEVALYTHRAGGDLSLHSAVVTGSGTGSYVTADITVPCLEGDQDAVTVWWRALVDPSNDPVVTSANWSGLSATSFGDATWGTPAMGFGGDDTWQFYSKRRDVFIDNYVASQYLAGSPPKPGWRIGRSDSAGLSRSGFYIYMTSRNQLHEIRDPVFSSGFSPIISIAPNLPFDLESYQGVYYTMRQLPEAHIESVAIYEVWE